MLEDLIYEWKDLVFVLIFGGVCPAIFLYVIVRILRQARGPLPENELWGVGVLVLLAIGMPVVALLLYYDIASEGSIFIAIACSVVAVALTVAIVAKHREIRAAQGWLQTTGTIITSRVESRKKQPGDFDYDDTDTEVTNSPLVEYEYQVNGKSFRCSRITIGARTSEYELESILDRHPVGAPVVVYYNPADPQQAVLERDFPASVYWIGGGCVVFSIAVPVAAIVIYHIGLTWFNGGAIVLGGMGLATFALAVSFTAMSWQASTWPIVRGRIVAADVKAHYSRSNHDSGRRTYFKPSVLYAYEVNGRPYLGDRVRIAVVISSTLSGLAGAAAARYPVGMEVDVHYNPKKPGESVLHPWSWWIVLPWLIVVGLIGLGWALT